MGSKTQLYKENMEELFPVEKQEKGVIIAFFMGGSYVAKNNCEENVFFFFFILLYNSSNWFYTWNILAFKKTFVRYKIKIKNFRNINSPYTLSFAEQYNIYGVVKSIVGMYEVPLKLELSSSLWRHYFPNSIFKNLII